MYCVRWSQPNFAGMKSEQAAFGERFRQALKRRGLTQSASELAGLLASHGGVSVAPQAISAWLHGKSLPRPQNMRALARLLHMDPHELQFGFLFLNDEIVPFQMFLACLGFGLPTLHGEDVRSQSLHFHHVIVVELLALSRVVVHPVEYNVCVVIRLEPFFAYFETLLVFHIRLPT